MCKTYKCLWQLCNKAKFCLLIRFTKDKVLFFYPENIYFISLHSTKYFIWCLHNECVRNFAPD